MTYANTAERAALIAGLRDLANYLDSNPDVPAPVYSQVYAFPPEAEWAEMRADVRAVAARLGVTAYRTGGGHVFAARSFGPVEYRIVAIPFGSDTEVE